MNKTGRCSSMDLITERIKCPRCGSSKAAGLSRYVCGSYYLEGTTLFRQTVECAAEETKHLRKELAETEEELNTVKTLLSDILPLAMSASCRYSDHPEADVSQHCCDWGPIVDRICVSLGRGGEVPGSKEVPS